MRKMFLIRAALCAALATAGGAAVAAAPFSFAVTPGKLPKDVVPILYTAHIVPDIAANTFEGSETVEIEVRKPTSTIMLNAANLMIDAASLSGAGIRSLQLVPVLDQEAQTLSFALARPLQPGRYRLALRFRGHINREARGMFYLNYKAGGADKKMVVTTMQPADARRLLPCWDEPAFRARFKLSVDVPGGFSAYSNAPVEKRQALADGRQRVSFAVTPSMPSYLVNLAAGELERVSGKQDGVKVGIVTTAGKRALAAVPLAETKRLLGYFNDYFGIPYPLPKLDQIAIPGGFNGAMEDWGNIVYTESALLVDPARTPERARKTAFTVTAHEVAHQWFGNLVTMAWWDDLWLNEGFASWMASRATQHVHPEWRPYLDDLAGREEVLDLDARKTTHPIQTPIATEAQAANAFDAITYEKSHAFLRMLEAHLGEQAFRKGVRAYIARHQYSNTTSEDLWAALEQASGKPVRKLALDWTTQPGYPVIKVEQACVAGKRQVTLSQEQFRLDEPATEGRLWSVPLQLATVNGRPIDVLLTGRSARFATGACDGVLVVDPGNIGFFRVQYTQADFDALAAQVGRLPDTARLKLLTDAWSMVAADRMKLDSYLKLARQYRGEPRYAVWNALLGNLRTLEALARGEPEGELVRRFVVDLAKPAFARLGWEEKAGDSGEDRRLRALLAGVLAHAGDADAIAQAKVRLARYLDEPASVSPSMLDFVVLTGGRYADRASHEILSKKALASTSDEERKRFIRALAMVRDPALVEATLRLTLSPQLPANLIDRVLLGVAGEHAGKAWDFAVAHRDELVGSVDALTRERLFADLLGNSNDPVQADMMEVYVARHFGPEALAEARRAGNGVRIRAAQKARLLPLLKAALQ
jgi:aminopeptidase N